LFFESYTLLAAELKARVERTSTEIETTRRLAAPERQARFRALQGKLPGMVLNGPWEVGHGVTDTVVTMMEDNVLRYIPWEACVSREAELQGTKKLKEWRPGSDRVVREVETSIDTPSDIGSDYALYQTLTRRGYALEMGGACSHAVHDKWVQQLMAELQRPPPPKHARISIEQLRRADVELWKKIAEATRDGIQPDMTGARPIDAAMSALMRDPGVTLLLMPLPLQGSAKESGAGGSTGAARQGQRPKAPAVQPQRQAADTKVTKSQKKKAKTQRRTEKYGATTTPEGVEICFGFNSNRGCSGPCARAHVCQRCFSKAHPTFEHR
jgi:hypothetical protein